MSQLEQWVKMAEDELTEYSTDARKMENSAVGLVYRYH